MTFRFHLAVPFLALLILSSTFRVDAQVGLEDLFAPGPFLQDRNSDEVIDFVAARLLVGESPEPLVLAAAADIAARLGYETLAMDLPLVRGIAPDGGAGIVIGPSGLDQARLSRQAIGLDRLSEGEGLVTLLRQNGTDFLVVAGNDASGTRAAAQALAGRFPYLWKPGEAELGDILTDISALLSEENVEPRTAHVSEIRIGSGIDGIRSVTVTVELASDQAVATAENSLRTATRRSTNEANGEEAEPKLSYRDVETLLVSLIGPTESVTISVGRAAPDAAEARGGPIPARPGSGPKRDLDLSNLYTPSGLLGDSDSNLIPDRIDAVLSPEAASMSATIDLAARLGLESTGISIPILRLPDEIEKPDDEPTLVLIGEHHPLIVRLVEEEKVALPELQPGEGWIGVLPEAFGPKGAVLVTGGDQSGTDRALTQLTERLPHVWSRGKDRTTIDDVEMELWKFFTGRSPAGQAAIGLYKLDRLLEALSEKDLVWARVLVSVEKPSPELERLFREKAASLADELEVTVDDRDVENAETIFAEEFEVASEVDEFWRLFRDRLLPRVRRGRPVTLEARLSEPPAIRQAIAEKARKELIDKGAAPKGTEVRVLSAFKQGYSWLYEVIRPELQGKEIANLTLRFKKNVPPEEWPQQAMQTPVRWLHEMYPIDEILARELSLDLDQIQIEMAPEEAPAYRVEARAANGEVLLSETFEPKVVLRPYLDRFRDYEMVRVTTGWVTARVGDEAVLDQRIITDAERFWDYYQETLLPRMYDYVMKLHAGDPRGNGRDAPYFGELEVDLTLSEPHYLLDLDQELISPMDALHEDIYFTTLIFFRLLGRNARGEELTYPGRVLPVMHPKADGKAGRAKIRFTGFGSSRPAVVIAYRERGGREGEVRLDIPKVAMDRPRALAALVRAGTEGIERLEVRVKVDTEKDERDELSKRTRALEVDEEILSAAQVTAMVEHLNTMRAAGLYQDALAFHDLRELQVAAGWEHKIDHAAEPLARLEANGRPAPFPDVTRYLGTAAKATGAPAGMVQWETPIPPPEANAILAEMARFEEATVYKLGESYLGKEIWAMDLMPPIEASHWSQYKATTLKPTVIYSARQHANEVSSTSHVLRLAELLLTDESCKEQLKKANVVIHPITNPDGAQLAYDLYRITPELILHAGYLASLGMDVTSDENQPMPIYPEARFRADLWNTWLPDIFLNPHGYPAHQLVQLFSGYTGLVRRGRITERNWSMNKGWFIPGFSYLDDPEYPRHKAEAFKIRDYITRAINEAPSVYDLNQRNYARYQRYGGRFDEDVFKLPMVDEVMIHTAIKGSRAPGPGARSGYNPKITVWSGSTEAPDETAHGDWMKLVATAGLQWDKAILQYLVDGNHEVERKSTEFWGGVHLSMDRPRPPKPEEEPGEEEEATRR